MAAQSQISFEFDETSKPAPAKRGRKPLNRPPKPKQKRGRKSLKEMVDEADVMELPSDEVLRKKLYYSIGEVSEMFKINPSSLRYWETEFTIIKPKKNKKGDRFYTAADIKKLHLIYYLLRFKKYTIEAAKDYLKKHKEEAEVRFELVQSLQQIKAFLLTIKADL
ncbi:MAG: MerR family transcriptional regulator [Chitinophagaceae bacterium]|nr:MerR family transcriptional regulator [Chitinophagaceae bacterium]